MLDYELNNSNNNKKILVKQENWKLKKKTTRIWRSNATEIATENASKSFLFLVSSLKLKQLVYKQLNQLWNIWTNHLLRVIQASTITDSLSSLFSKIFSTISLRLWINHLGDLTKIQCFFIYKKGLECNGWTGPEQISLWRHYYTIKVYLAFIFSYG